MAFQPTTLTRVSGSWSTIVYTHNSTLSSANNNSHEVYSAYENSNLLANHEIAVNRSTNIWDDYGTDNPTIVADPDVAGSGASNGIVDLKVSADNTVRYAFTKPTTADWISSGNGTNTEGSSYSGTLTQNGTTLEYDIPSSSSSGSYYLLSGVNGTFTLELTISVASNGASGSAPNFDQTKIWILRSPTEDELDRWSPLSKKVCCNFW